ncbi:SWIM zinc finger family protein [Streptomyces sp. NPDC004528]|uniref:SWIM zinc finger family protein n=1 Tax=Streptomyces sp. NPDC004528 TaxID=3154550 RepID=UPI0033AA7C0C
MRAAREREGRDLTAEGEPGPPPGSSPVVPVAPVAPVPPGGRPADAARQALRRATARGSVPGAGAGAGAGVGAGAGAGVEPGTERASGPTPWSATPENPSAACPSTAVDANAPADANGPADPGGTATAQGATRPGDVARKALRAARGEARRARTDAEGGAPQPRRRSADRTPPTGTETPAEADTPVRTEPSDGTGTPHQPSTPTPAPGATEPPDTPPPSESGSGGPGERGAARAARLPRSTGASARDGELRRTFAALPARSPDAAAFARTWWGNAWVSALEEGALDPARLARGRAYADKGRVDAVTVTPGLVLAYVHGSRPRPYRAQVAVRTLDDEDWDRFLDAAAERPGHIAALLDKEMPRSLADCGVDLLPGPADLVPRCSCPDDGHPCKHAAALCYETARLLDEDPFVLLLLRGRGERDLLDGLSRRNAARAARAAQEREPAPLPGVRARDALARRSLPPLPAPLPAPAHPEQPPTYPGAPGGPDPFALDQLATDAAARAHALLTAGRDPVADLTLWQDAVRLAAARPGSGLTAATRALYSSLASAAGRTTADLARAVAAWRQGGIEGLSVLEEPWDPPAGRFDRARPLLLAADFPAFRPWRNRLTHPRGHAQLRLGHDGLWYAYESEPGQDDWWPRGTPDLDPVGALTGLGTPEEF